MRGLADLNARQVSMAVASHPSLLFGAATGAFCIGPGLAWLAGARDAVTTEVPMLVVGWVIIYAAAIVHHHYCPRIEAALHASRAARGAVLSLLGRGTSYSWREPPWVARSIIALVVILFIFGLLTSQQSCGQLLCFGAAGKARIYGPYAVASLFTINLSWFVLQFCGLCILTHYARAWLKMAHAVDEASPPPVPTRWTTYDWDRWNAEWQIFAEGLRRAAGLSFFGWCAGLCVVVGFTWGWLYLMANGASGASYIFLLINIILLGIVAWLAVNSPFRTAWKKDNAVRLAIDEAVLRETEADDWQDTKLVSVMGGVMAWRTQPLLGAMHGNPTALLLVAVPYGASELVKLTVFLGMSG